jgi:lipid-A-disaccharide synthase
LNYFLSTGEPSGEMSAVLLANAIRERDPEARFEGIGATAMRDAGIALWRNHTGWASMGPLEAIPRIPVLLLQMWLTALHVAARKPDLVVLVDFGVFNVRLAQTLRTRLDYRGPILYLFPPAAWLDSERAARAVARLTIPVSGFAHQTAFYRSLGLRVEYFGHPLLDRYEARAPRAAPPHDAGTVALLPGSRAQELRYHLPLMLQALRELRRSRRNVRAVLAAAAPRFVPLMARAAQRYGGAEIVLGARRALADADAAWVASGTAVLESVLLGVPTIAVFVVSPSVVWYGRRMQRRIYGGRFITLPNLVLQEEVVPELLQDAATPDALAHVMGRTLDDPHRALTKLPQLREALGPAGAMQRCAALAVDIASRRA